MTQFFALRPMIFYLLIVKTEAAEKGSAVVKAAVFQPLTQI